MITVTAPATHRELTTLATVKAELGIEDAASDALLASMIQQVTDAVDEYTQRMLAKVTVTETVRGYGTPSLRVSVTPIVGSIAEITYEGAVIDAAEYEIEDRGAGLIRRLPYGAVWPARWVGYGGVTRRPIAGTEAYAYTVSYTGGYVMPIDPSGLRDLPRDIERAAIDAVKQLYYARQRDPSVLQEAVPDVYSVRYDHGSEGMPFGLFGQAARILDRHKRLAL